MSESDGERIKSLEITKTDAVGGSVEYEIMKIVKVVKVALLSVLQQRQYGNHWQ